MSRQYPNRQIMCFGCNETHGEDAMLTAKCLGCGSKYRRCAICFGKFTGCSSECQRLQRKALADAWVKPAPIEDKGK